MASRPGDKHILDVVPQFPMLFQVDNNGYLAALLIGDKLDSAHVFIVLQMPASAFSQRPVASLHFATWGVAGVLFANWAFWKVLEPGASTTTDNPIVMVVSIGAALLSLGLVLVMSLAGFYEGWRIGWACANGRQFREVVWEGSTVGLYRRVALRVLPVRLTSP